MTVEFVVSTSSVLIHFMIISDRLLRNTCFLIGRTPMVVTLFGRPLEIEVRTEV